MKIQHRVLEKLDFGKVLERLSHYCFLPRTKEMAEVLEPLTDRNLVKLKLDETNEGKELLRLNPMFSVRGAKEIRSYLERCIRGGVLNPEELLHVRDTLRAGRQLFQFFQEDKIDYKRLKEITLTIVSNKNLEDEIKRCISEEGTVADTASSELAELRKSKARLQERIRQTLEGVLRNHTYQKMLQEALITQRSDRYVIPVKQEYRSAFPGIVHDQSASGATLFIEPMPAVQLGNELREVIVKEEREIQRILIQLSGTIQANAEEIAELHEAIAKIDLILAKAKLSNEMNATAPDLMEGQLIRLIKARHPLIEGAVPLSIDMGKTFITLVVTGPNTGGKTVALKTIGLAVVMAQAGLHIPAEDKSAIGVFDQIFVDIGDEQSVEQSLSTFSGHMKNIVHIIDNADHSSLVLLDEVGAGTDPSEGAALAMAVLTELHERGCRTMATTHYGALKSFAYETPLVENASVEFDAETLRPTYRLLVGVPGKSNAFNIAQRLGLKIGILEKAKLFLTEREVKVADLIENLEDIQREIELNKVKIQEEKRKIEETSRELEQKEAKLEEKYQMLSLRAKDEAAEVIRQARQEALDLINDLKMALKKEHKEQQDIDKARQKMHKLSGKIDSESGDKKTGGISPNTIKLGQMVYMTKLRQKGQVLKLPNANGEVLVQAGILKVNVPLTDLRLIEQQPEVPKRNTGGGKLGQNKAETIRSEIDLRGMMVDEATYALDKYLDDAILSGISQIYIIHGKGTGALRMGIQDFLKGHPHIKSFRFGEHGEGDLGVTVAELK